MDAETIKEIRVEILRYLYCNPVAAMPARAICRAVKTALGEDQPEETIKQIAVKIAHGHVKAVEDDEMPGLSGYQITGEGIKHYERHHA